MFPTANTRVLRLGMWSAVASTVCSIMYDLGQVAEWLGWLGSTGGPEATSTPLGIVVLLTPSLVLGTAFLLLLIAIHHGVEPERRVWSHAAVVFGGIYTTMISINYYVQLAWVGPRLAAGRPRNIEPFVFVPFDSFLYAVDILGYSFMSVACLLLVHALDGEGLVRWTRRFLAGTGAVLPFLLLQMYVHDLIWFASVWAIVFPAATWTLAVLFHRQLVTARARAHPRPLEALSGA